MGIGTYEAYRERLSKMKPNVYLDGKCVDRNGDWIEGGCYVMKVCYDMANDPKFADVCTVKSHLTGEIINRCTHIPVTGRPAEETADDTSDLPQGRRMHAEMHGYGCLKCNCSGVL